MSKLIWSMFSGGTSNTISSSYTGFRVFLLVDVFLFFSLRPSHIRDTFTYGSGDGEDGVFREAVKMYWHMWEAGNKDCPRHPVCRFSGFTIAAGALHCHSAPTWGPGDVHGFEISGFDHGDGEPASRGEITQGEHQLPQVHVVLQTQISQW